MNIQTGKYNFIGKKSAAFFCVCWRKLKWNFNSLFSPTIYYTLVDVSCGGLPSKSMWQSWFFHWVENNFYFSRVISPNDDDYAMPNVTSNPLKLMILSTCYCRHLEIFLRSPERGESLSLNVSSVLRSQSQHETKRTTKKCNFNDTQVQYLQSWERKWLKP